MAFTDDLTELMSTTVTVKTLSGLSTDGRGVETWSTGTSVTARVVYEQKLVQSFEGTDEVSNTTVWIASTSTYSPSLTQFQLASGATPQLLRLETFTDENGPTHSKGYFG